MIKIPSVLKCRSVLEKIENESTNHPCGFRERWKGSCPVHESISHEYSKTVFMLEKGML